MIIWTPTCAVVGRLADVDVRPESQFQLLLELVLEVVHGVCEAPPSRQIGLAAILGRNIITHSHNRINLWMY